MALPKILSVKTQVNNASVSDTENKIKKIKVVMARNMQSHAEDAVIAEVPEPAKKVLSIKKTNTRANTKSVKAATEPKKAKSVSKSVSKEKPSVAMKVVKKTVVSPVDDAKLKLSLIQYSDKCIAVFGDTKTIKNELKALKGRFNPSLHPFGTESSVPGWIFPLKAQEEVQKLVNKYAI